MGSIILQVLEKQVAEEFFSSSAFADAKEHIVTTQTRSKYRIFNLDIDKHNIQNNHKNATEIGCGCTLCMSRFYYVNAKMNLNFLKKSYLDDRYFYLFDDLYARMADACDIGINTHADFYRYKKAEQELIIAQTRDRFYVELKKYKTIFELDSKSNILGIR